MRHHIELYESRTLFAGGALDTNFGQGGYADLNIAAYSEKFTRVAAGPNNTIVVAGNVGTNEFVARYTAQGQLDTSFNGSGYIQINSNTGYSVTALSVLADGKVLIGTSQANNGIPGSVARITRLTSTGQLDSTWSGDGVWTGSWSGRLHSTVQGFVPLADGSVIVAGDDGNSVLIRKLSASGVLESGFYASVNPPADLYADAFQANAFAASGNRIAVGAYGSSTSLGRFGLIAMFKTDGTLDTSFDGDGVLNPSPALPISDLAFDTSGRLLVGQNAQKVFRLAASGALDTSFGAAGAYTSSDSPAWTNALVPLPNDGLMLVERRQYPLPSNVVFLTSAGAIDTTRGTNGLTELGLNAYDGVRLADGSIAIAGLKIASYDLQDMRLAKLTSVSPPVVQTGSISGFTFDDSNRNGVLDSGETKTSGKTVFLDSNNNGKLDTGEKSTKTSTAGAYSFTGLVAGTYYVRRVFPAGYTYSTAPLDFTLAAGQNITNANIGSKSGATPPPPTNTGSISGFLFWDSDRDGKFDTGESYQTGKTVFIDLDDDNILDSNEKRVTSDSSGKFTFTGLSAGTYVIKRVVPSGYKITTPKQVVTLTAGQVFSGVAIGTNT